jgi:4-hydroxybenzoate polyprenyltransferase
MTSNVRIKAFLKVSRANLLLASIGHATLGLSLGAGSLDALLHIEVPLYIALHYSIAFLACNINCLYDYDVDRRYKRYMSDSIDTLGKKPLKIILVLEFFIALILTGYFFSLGFYITGAAAILGILGAISYSAEPIRIKKRGLVSPLPILLLYMLPLIGGWFVFKQTLEFSFVIFLLGYALMNEGYTLVNMCEDYSEDQDEGIRTWAHIFGLKKTLTLAYFFAISGMLCVFALGYNLYLEFVGLRSTPALISIIFAAVLIFMAAIEVGQVRHGENLEERAKVYGKRLQRWFMMTRYPLMVASILLLL